MLIFDFDGVLIDSVKEVAVVAYNVLNDQKINDLENLPEGYLELFETNRPSAKNAADMAALARWCLSHDEKPLLSTDEFVLIAAADPLDEEVRRDSFFGERKKLLELSEEKWVKLSPPYFPIWESIMKMPVDDVILATHKNLDAVMRICHGNKVPIKRENIYSGDQGTSKSEHFIELLSRFPGRKLTFIDDSLRNLLEIKESLDSETELLFPTWGYAGPGDAELAHSEGIRIVDQESFIREFMNYSPISTTAL